MSKDNKHNNEKFAGNMRSYLVNKGDWCQLAVEMFDGGIAMFVRTWNEDEKKIEDWEDVFIDNRSDLQTLKLFCEAALGELTLDQINKKLKEIRSDGK